MRLLRLRCYTIRLSLMESSWCLILAPYGPWSWQVPHCRPIQRESLMARTRWHGLDRLCTSIASIYGTRCAHMLSLVVKQLSMPLSLLFWLFWKVQCNEGSIFLLPKSHCALHRGYFQKDFVPLIWTATLVFDCQCSLFDNFTLLLSFFWWELHCLGCPKLTIGLTIVSCLCCANIVATDTYVHGVLCNGW